MCVNSATFAYVATRVGIRELRQNLSVYLRRVAHGERFVVTERREPVAELGPLSGDAEEDDDEAWLRRHNLSRPKGRWEDLPPPLPRVPGQRPMSELIIEEREQDRF